MCVFRCRSFFPCDFRQHSLKFIMVIFQLSRSDESVPYAQIANALPPFQFINPDLATHPSRFRWVISLFVHYFVALFTIHIWPVCLCPCCLRLPTFSIILSQLCQHIAAESIWPTSATKCLPL